MITLRCDLSHKNERKYIIETIFWDFLGIPCKIIFGEFENYTVAFDRGSFVIRDAFFGTFEEYLIDSVIPERVEFLGELPVIYGENRMKKNYCGLDIFGSAFFMLSRFEESVLKIRDSYDRFPSGASLAVRSGFEKKAVVNGYVELLWNLLLQNGYTGERKKWKFTIMPTHDIDHLTFYKNFDFFFTRLKKCLFKYKNFPQALKEVRDFLLVRLRITKDPYDRFDELMEIAERFGLKAIFYFLVGKESVFDADFDIAKLKPIMKNITKRGHVVGIHPSFESYKNSTMIYEECNFFEIRPTYSRQHYLRFEIPTTWEILEKAGLRIDSSLGFGDRVGFRCGCCYSFHVFDVVQKKRLKIKESPLLVMDGVLLDQSKEAAKKEVLEIASEVQKYGGEMVILWHNSSFGVDRWKKFNGLYEEILKELA